MCRKVFSIAVLMISFLLPLAGVVTDPTEVKEAGW